jgi:hypothetical protein
MQVRRIERRGYHVKELTTLGSWLRSCVAARPVKWSVGYCLFARVPATRGCRECCLESLVEMRKVLERL